MLIPSAFRKLPNEKGCYNGQVVMGSNVAQMASALAQLSHCKFLGEAHYQISHSTYSTDWGAEQYGARVLAEPPRSGFNWLVYIVPPVAFLAGAFILYRGFRAWRQIEPEIVEPIAADQDAASDDYLARFEEELKRSDQ